MFHSRSGHTMSATARSTEAGKPDIELQEVGPFAGAAADSSPPPQTRPFTGVLDQHHCLLSQPHGRQFFPASSEILHQFTPDSANSKKRQSSGVHHPERGHRSATQSPERRRSSSSQKMQSSVDTPPPPYSSMHMAEVRREQINGVPTTSGNDHHVLENNDTRIDKDVVNTQPLRKERVPPSNIPSSGQASDFSEANPVNNKTDGVQRKAGSNYERLRPGPSTSQHLYRPIVEKPDVTPAKSITTLKPSESSRPPQGARSPLYDSVNVCTEQVKPEAHPFLPSRRSQLADHPDEIIELQSEITRPGTSREEKQNKSNTQKEVPQISDIPNTNFAIACMVALCFNLPFGVLAMYFSLRAVKAFQDGRSKLGERRSRWSIVLSLLGITITTVIISSVVLYTAMEAQKKNNRQKTYGTRTSLNL